MRDSDSSGASSAYHCAKPGRKGASEFTPWLTGNVDQLTRVVGIPVELVDSEVDVEEFSADVLARDSTDGSLVLIENWLERSDHGHLGKILTYRAVRRCPHISPGADNQKALRGLCRVNLHRKDTSNCSGLDHYDSC